MRPRQESRKQGTSNGSMNKIISSTTSTNNNNTFDNGIRYRECRKNHAATIGGYAVDGCREFMASGEEGTSASLKCAACTCHRNFHRREVADQNDESQFDCSSNNS